MCGSWILRLKMHATIPGFKFNYGLLLNKSIYLRGWKILTASVLIDQMWLILYSLHFRNLVNHLYLDLERYFICFGLVCVLRWRVAGLCSLPSDIWAQSILLSQASELCCYRCYSIETSYQSCFHIFSQHFCPLPI